MVTSKIKAITFRERVISKMKKLESETTVPGGGLAIAMASESKKDSDPYRTMMLHKRQTNAAVGGLMPLLSHGYCLAWGIYILTAPNRHEGIVSRKHLWHATVAYFWGSIIGAIIGYFMVRKYKKIVIYISASVLLLASGSLLFPSHIWATIISRYLGGIGTGLAMLTSLIHLPEVASKDIRGSVVAVISVIIAASLFAAGSTHSAKTSEHLHDFDLLTGGLTILYTCLGLALLACFNMESPVFLIQNNREKFALDTMRRLRLDTIESKELLHDFEETKNYIGDEKCRENVRFEDKGLSVFSKVLLLRVLTTISNGLFLMALFFSFTQSLSPRYGSMIMLFGRLFSEMLALYLIEKVGRRRLLCLSLMGCGFIMIMSAFLTIGGEMDLAKSVTLGVLAIGYQAFIGIGLNPVATVYLTEFFSLKRKPISIMVILIVENILQILFVIPIGFSLNLVAVFMTIGLLQIGAGYAFRTILPETKGMTLRECLYALK